jgi:hypothetical protein
MDRNPTTGNQKTKKMRAKLLRKARKEMFKHFPMQKDPGDFKFEITFLWGSEARALILLHARHYWKYHKYLTYNRKRR